MISQEKAKQMMKGDVIVLDVREKNEYLGGHIKDAQSTPLSNIAENVKKIVKDKSNTLLVYCHSGARSNMAEMKLKKMGYTNVHNFGGIMTWQHEIVS